MQEPLRIQLDLDPGEGPIAGRLISDEGEFRFTGWLGLIAGLQGAIGDRGRRSDHPVAPPPEPERGHVEASQGVGEVHERQEQKRDRADGGGGR
jgi:hypothetical protein